MRQNPRRRALRHVLAGLCALPFILTVFVRHIKSDEANITAFDEWTKKVALYIGDASFACTGSLAAGMEGMDLLGCIIVGCVTSLGGGSIRDILLGNTPIFWLTACDEFVVVVGVSTFTFFCWPPLSMRWKLTPTGEWLFWTDALGLGVFAATGAVLAAERGDLHTAACAACGMFTATFGGVMRDILTARPPRIFYPYLESYAIPALIGGLASAFVIKFIDKEMAGEAIMLGFWVTIHGRVFSVNHGLRLPHFPARSVYSKSARPRDIAAQRALEEDLDKESIILGVPEQHSELSVGFVYGEYGAEGPGTSLQSR